MSRYMVINIDKHVYNYRNIVIRIFPGTAMKANMVSHGIRNRFTIVIASWVMDHRI